MRIVEQHPTVERVKVDVQRQNGLKSWLTTEVEDALASRSEQEALWREMLRLYEGVPKNPVKDFPIENAPNMEVTLGAIACDSIYAQALDLIFSVKPMVTVNATSSRFIDQQKAFRRFIEFVARNESGARMAAENSFLDDIQLGTGIFYVPWVDEMRKTRVHDVRNRGPRIMSLPVEDFIVPGGAFGDIQTLRWCGPRFWLTESELNERAKLRGWNIEGTIPLGNISWVRSQRERLGRTSGSRKIGLLYEIMDIYAYYDIDGDGIDEDLLITWDRTSRNILKLRFNPYDRRPFEGSVYQRRGHLFYGMGVMEMIRPFQEEVSDTHNHRRLNMLLANTRFWKARTGSVPEETRIWPGKVQFMDSPEDLVGEQMGEIYPSSAQDEGIGISLAERRVGVSDMSIPRPSQILGSRTPGITALTMMQKVNQRFTPAFDSMKFALANAVKQCMFRYQERLLAGDVVAEKHILDVLGPTEGQVVVGVLKSKDFDNGLVVEMMASSSTVNKESERQNAILLVNLLATYYQRSLELVMLASNPEVPETVRSTARKIAESASNIIERTVRTFDEIRDPEAFIVDIVEEIDKTEGVSQTGLQGLGNLLADELRNAATGALENGGGVQ